VASVRYGEQAIQWAGIVLVMADGSKRAVEIQHPYYAQFKISQESGHENYEVTVSVTGLALPWASGEHMGPTRAIATPTPEIERG
jgi:hypothetical protein